MATIGAGGLQFQQTDEVKMEREDLYLSPLEVRVSYVFRNLTNRDVRMRVAFPMPDVDVYGMSETPHAFHRSSREGDVFDFHVQVHGFEIVSDIEARAYKSDQPEKEVTAVLRKYKMPLLADDGPVTPHDKADTKSLVAEGLMDEERHPFWFVKVNFHWEQVFPANQTIEITHRYTPVVGGTHTRFEGTLKDWASFCLDQAFANAAKALPADNDGLVLVSELEYVLMTGANWAGPIGHFRLEINKAGADLISLCPIPGLKLQRRGRSFVAEAAEYRPSSDIKLMYIYRACETAPCGINADWPGYPRR